MVGAPVWRGERQFFMRRTAEQEHAVLLTVDPDGTERVLLDPMALDPTGLTTLDAWQPDKEGDLLAYQLSEGGTEESVAARDGRRDRRAASTARSTGAATPPSPGCPAARPTTTCAGCRPTLVPDGRGAVPPPGLAAPGRHRPRPTTSWSSATGLRDDQLLRRRGLAATAAGWSVSAAEGTAPRNDLWLADLPRPPPEAPTCVVVQEDVDAQTGAQVGRDGRLYVFTDRDAPRGRLCVTDPTRPTVEHWRDLIPEDPEAVLDGLRDPRRHRARAAGPARVAGPGTRSARSRVHDLATGERIGDGAAARARLDRRHRRAARGRPRGVVRLHRPHHAADRSTATTRAPARPRCGPPRPAPSRCPTVHARQVDLPVRGRHDGPDVRHRRRPTAPTGPRPDDPVRLRRLRHAADPGYSATILAWVEAGGVYAIANLRGGGEEGEEWHRAGMLGNKQNVFDDFHAAAERLVADGWTTADQLAISGGSNGGLLVGAALTQRPELYAAVVCSAPLLDMVRYEQFGLGATWNVEYGTRRRRPSELGWLLAYSPVPPRARGRRPTRRRCSPSSTATPGSTRCTPARCAPRCSTRRRRTRPILLRDETEVGHGARAVTRSVDLSADTLAFTAACTGLDLSG